MTRAVVFAPEAEDDLDRLYAYIAARSGVKRAFDYVDRIAAHCEKLGEFAERGEKRDDVRPGLRVTGFERRVAIAFHLTAHTVVIDRVLYGGRDVDKAFK